MTIRLRLVSLAIRTLWPRPRPLTPLQEAAAVATRELVVSRARRAGMSAAIAD